MRVLIANEHRALVGGAEKYLQAVIPGLTQLGHQVRFLYEHPVAADHESIGLESPSAAWCAGELGRDAAMRAVADWKPDVVYCNGLQDGSIEGALLQDYSTILFAHNYYGTCATGRKCHAFPRPQPCERHFGLMCLLLHYPRRCGGLNPATAWSMYQRQAQTHARLSAFRAVLVASTHMRDEYLRHGVDPARLHLLPLPATDILRQPGPPAKKTPQGRILFLSRLTDVKGGCYLLESIPSAAEKLGTPLALTVAGDGPERGKLETLARKLGIDVTFSGWVNTSRKQDLLRRADLIAVPSVWPEPFGLVGVEAGSLGVPAVGYAVGGISDWLVAGQSGELAAGDPPTVEGLADAIVRALCDPHHYNRLCRGAWDMAARFTLETHVARLEAILSGNTSALPEAHSVVDCH